LSCPECRLLLVASSPLKPEREPSFEPGFLPPSPELSEVPAPPEPLSCGSAEPVEVDFVEVPVSNLIDA
jgi:hypothetical protein